VLDLVDWSSADEFQLQLFLNCDAVSANKTIKNHLEQKMKAQTNEEKNAPELVDSQSDRPSAMSIKISSPNSIKFPLLVENQSYKIGRPPSMVSSSSYSSS
jgi:hypothetical protein